jgi:hypothetical protein
MSAGIVKMKLFLTLFAAITAEMLVTQKKMPPFYRGQSFPIIKN